MSLAGAANAAPDLVLGLAYLTVLVDRSLLPEGMVNGLVRAIPIEFAVVHASGFLAWPWVARTWPFRRRARFVARRSWAPEPQNVLAAGFAYFTAYGLSEMTDHAWLFRWLGGMGRRLLASLKA